MKDEESPMFKGSRLLPDPTLNSLFAGHLFLPGCMLNVVIWVKTPLIGSRLQKQAVK